MNSDSIQNGETTDCITKGIKKKSSKRGCGDTSIPNILLRNCPVCHKTIVYRNKYTCRKSELLNLKCHSCGNLKTPNRKLYERSCPNCNLTITYISKSRFLGATKIGLKCARCRQLGIKHNVPKGRGPMSGKKHSIHTKTKMRLSHIKRSGVGKWIPSFNLKACVYLDSLNASHGWELQHAKNGGEFFIEKLGYWVDGYDKNRNIVVEYDEPRHYSLQELNLCDLNRMLEIKSHLKCEFYRFNEKSGSLVKY